MKKTIVIGPILVVVLSVASATSLSAQSWVGIPNLASASVHTNLGVNPWVSPVACNNGVTGGMLQATLPAAAYNGCSTNGAIVGWAPAIATAQGVHGVGGYGGTSGSTTAVSYASGLWGQAYNGVSSYGVQALAKIDAAIAGTGGNLNGVRALAQSNQTRTTGTMIGGFFSADPDNTRTWLQSYGAQFYAGNTGNVTNAYGAFAKVGSTPGTITTSYGFRADVTGGATKYGIYGGVSGAGTINYGVYGSAAGATTNWAAYFVGNGFLSTPAWTYSDRSCKTNIRPLEGALTSILRLSPRTYEFDRAKHPSMNFPEGQQIGLISQDLREVLPMLTMDVHHPDQKNSDGLVTEAGFDFIGVNYTGLIPVLIGAVQEQQSIIDDKQAQIDALNRRLAELEKKLGATPAATPALNGASDGMSIAPNPFSDHTTITYAVGCHCRVQLQVTTADGKPMTTLLDEQRTQGNYTHEWDTTGLAAGMYYCTLLVDGHPMVKRAVKVSR